MFINLVHTKDMPAPRDIGETELMHILQSEEPSSYKIAMSLADPHIEADKGGNPCDVYDVAINSDFFKKVASSKFFKRFVFTVISEGLENKYKFEMDENADLIELKNRPAMGILQFHRIEQRPIIYGEAAKPKLLIEELETKSGDSEQNVLILRSPVSGPVEHFRVFVHVKNIDIPEVLLGEDRIVVKDSTSLSSESFVEEFLPSRVNCEKAQVINNRSNPNVLELILPVV